MMLVRNILRDWVHSRWRMMLVRNISAGLGAFEVENDASP